MNNAVTNSHNTHFFLDDEPGLVLTASTSVFGVPTLGKACCCKTSFPNEFFIKSCFPKCSEQILLDLLILEAFSCGVSKSLSHRDHLETYPKNFGY